MPSPMGKLGMKTHPTSIATQGGTLGQRHRCNAGFAGSWYKGSGVARSYEKAVSLRLAFNCFLSLFMYKRLSI